jgi:hypothetical protein
VPLIISKISKAGYFVEEINLSDATDNSVYSYHLKIISSRLVPFNVYVPSFLITPHAQMLESIGLSIYIGRDTENKPIFKIIEFKYTPSSHYLHTFTSMSIKIKEKIQNCLTDISYALNAEDLSIEKILKIKQELYDRTLLACL